MIMAKLSSINVYFKKIRLRFSGRHFDVGLLPFVVCSVAEYDKRWVARSGSDLLYHIQSNMIIFIDFLSIITIWIIFTT